MPRLAFLAVFLALTGIYPKTLLSQVLPKSEEERIQGFARDYGTNEEGDSAAKQQDDQWGIGSKDSVYTSLGLASAFGSGFEGNMSEFQSHFALANPIQVNHLEFGSDLGELAYGEMGIYNPGDRDQLYWGKARHFQYWDLFGSWKNYYFVNRPSTDFSQRREIELAGLLRAFKKLRGSFFLQSLQENSKEEPRSRDNSNERLGLELKFLDPSLEASIGVERERFRDSKDGYNDWDSSSFAFEMQKELWQRTRFSMKFDHQSVTHREEQENLRETNIDLRAYAYGPFNLPKLRLRGEASYKYRPSSFVINSEEEEAFRSGASFLYLLGKATLSAGLKHRESKLRRLSRAGVEKLLETTGTPSSVLEELSIEERPKISSAWLEARIDGGRDYAISLSLEDRTLGASPQTALVEGGSPSLYVNEQLASRISFTLRPRSALNLSVNHSRERRLWQQSDRAPEGRSYRASTQYLLNLGGLIDRFHGSINASSLELQAKSHEAVNRETNDLWAVGLHGNYRLTDSYDLFLDLSNIHSQGADESRERISSFGIRYESGAAKALEFELAYILDRFRDDLNSSNDFTARTLSLSSEIRF